MVLDPSRFTIDWQPPDLTPGAALLQAAKNSRLQNERSDAYLDLQRQAMANSAERHSHEWERDREREERRRAIETWNAMPMLHRAAMRSVGMANTNPYGVRFDETRDPPAAPQATPKAGVPMPAPVQAAAPAQLADGDRVVGQTGGLPHVDPPFQLHPDEEGPEQFPGPEEDRFFLAEQRQPRTTVAPMVPVQAENMDALGDAERRAIAENITSVGNRTTLATPNLTGRTAADSDPRMVSPMDDPELNEPITADVPRAPQPEAAPPQPAQPLMMQAATNSFAPEGKRRVFASYGGNRFELPEMSDKTPFGPEYDAIYQGLINANEDPHKAMAEVARQYREDQRQEKIAQRTAANIAAQIGGRSESREDEQKFRAEQDAKYRRTFEEAMKLARIAAMRSDPSGGASAQVMAALAQHAIDNPGDLPGLYKLSDQLHAPMPGKAVTSITGGVKSTEGQKDDALHASQGLRAADTIKQSRYVPSRDHVQKWLNNQRWVYMAKRDSASGLFVLGGQTLRLLPQSEVEGLPPEAQEYFANVRRLMEPLGRAASGAAISEGEWVNFFNQYGPNSPGGIDAAKRDLSDRFRLSGTAGRSLGEASTRAPGSGGGGSASVPVGTIRIRRDGTKMRKVGPNNWQPVRR